MRLEVEEAREKLEMEKLMIKKQKLTRERETIEYEWDDEEPQVTKIQLLGGSRNNYHSLLTNEMRDILDSKI